MVASIHLFDMVQSTKLKVDDFIPAECSWVQLILQSSVAQTYFTVLAAGNSTKHTQTHIIPPATHFTIVSSPCLLSLGEHYAVWGALYVTLCCCYSSHLTMQSQLSKLEHS
jgi:hypothetical protein